MVSKKRQQSGIIDCTFTIASISSIGHWFEMKLGLRKDSASLWIVSE